MRGFTPHIKSIVPHFGASRQYSLCVGFTLIELIISLGIIGTLLLLTFISASSFRAHTNLVTSANNFLEDARSQQSKTVASEGASQYGMHLETTRYTLFKGSNFSSRDPAFDEVRNLPSSLEFLSWSIGGGNDIVFERVTGITQNSGTATLRHKDSVQVKAITIAPSGEVFFLGTPPTFSGSRITDTRHVHYDLGWSIQNSVTSSLVFGGTPPIIENISIQDYISGGKFDWSETIDVNGFPQTLRIQSHLLNPFDTILSVHRERDENDTSLNILIDSNLITSYDSGGNVIVGPFGGVMEIQ